MALVTDLLEPKYRAPRLREGIVWRTDLLARLQDARAQPLVILSAPAGYGKTTLLAQWTEQDERPSAWVTLGQGDRDPVVLAESIATALRPTGVDGTGFVLVIDDAHVGHPGVLKDAVLDVLAWLPPGSQVAMAARCEPLLPIARMRAHRTLFELSADELSMSPAEAASLLQDAGLDLQPAAVEDLVRRTEGWPVILELAAISVGGQPDPAEALTRLAGDDHLISAYFRDEFLAALSPSTRRFLSRSSVLERMSGPLCDAVLQRTRSAAVLARLAQSNVPLRAADPSHEWYCLHGLFREMLQTELRRSEPELAPALHGRAGDWHSKAGDLDRAIDHARRAGDLNRSGDLLWSNLPEYLGQGRNDSVQRWLGGATAEQATGCAPFALTAAHSSLAMGNIALAEQWARSAGVALSEKSEASTNAQRAGALLIHAWAARSGGARMAEDATLAYDLLSDDSPWRASCCFLRGTAALLIGDIGAAERHLEDGTARGAYAAPDIASLCLAQLAAVALEQGDADGAGELAQRARSLIETRNPGIHLGVALVSAVSAAAGMGQRRVDEAKVAAARCIGVIGLLEDFVPWYGAEARILLARGLLALGDVTGARRQLADASRLSRRTPGFVIFKRWFDEAWDQFDARAEVALSAVGSLTTAELRVLRFLPTHFSFHEIAQRLHVSSNTVKTHVHAVYRKLDASSRSEAVANATGAGLLGS